MILAAPNVTFLTSVKYLEVKDFTLVVLNQSVGDEIFEEFICKLYDSFLSYQDAQINVLI
jgi:tartrate dehydratase beta subunit/fumarate hydratase class I family protein